MHTLTPCACEGTSARRLETLARGDLNGIEDVEVDPGHRGIPRHCTLLVHCLRPLLAGLQGLRVQVLPDTLPPQRTVEVLWAAPAAALDTAAGLALATRHDVQRFSGEHADPALLVVRTSAPGDLSAYRLVIVNPEEAGFDPCLSEARFSFGLDCDTDVDCPAPTPCPPVRVAEPVIDYLSRDYVGLRQLLLDRLSVVARAWTDRNVADTGVTLVEIFAYLGDLLAAAQDTVAGEAYLGTARRRVSMARHARLLDYRMHHGAAARVWLVLEVDEKVSAGYARQVACSPADEPRPQMLPSGRQVRSADGSVVFRTLHAATPLAARNGIELHTWGLRDGCLPVGATSATLVGTTNDLQLCAGDVLVFEEVLGAVAGEPADVTHRWPVRLSADPVDDYDPVTSTPIVLVTWHDADRLPFPLCTRRFSRGRCMGDEGVAVARGNVVLAGHGRLIGPEPVVPGTVPLRGRYRPAIRRRGLAFTVPYHDAVARAAPAAEAMAFDPGDALADVEQLTDGRDDWTVRRDLIGSDRFAAEVVAEPDDDGTVHLRFGDDVSGRRPKAGQSFAASYRIGGGVAGNVGREVLTALEPPRPGVQVRNPMPATGGTEPESLEQVRQLAPQAFRAQERAVTDDDYAAVALRDPRVQRAVGTRRWTGSWYTEFVTVDRLGGMGVDAALRSDLAARLERYRMAGSDVTIQAPVYVPLSIELAVQVSRGSFRGTVKDALQQAFSTRDLPGGGRGFFHVDNFTFGTPVYLSAVVAAATAVSGVAWVDVVTFQRLGQDPAGELADGLIAMERLEVALCDSAGGDGSSGRVAFTMSGGS